MQDWLVPAKNLVKSSLDFVGLEIRRSEQAARYLDPARIRREAERSGTAVPEYVERVLGISGNTDRVFAFLDALGVLNHEIESFLEIGPGTGRYCERVFRRFSPKTYQIYELSPGWTEYLVDRFGVTAMPADGGSLSSTASESIEFVHAHGVLVYTPFLVTCAYLKEMARVVRQGGCLVFDILSNDTLCPDLIEKWLKSPHRYPALFPKECVFNFLHGFDLIEARIIPYDFAVSEYLVLRKRTMDPNRVG